MYIAVYTLLLLNVSLFPSLSIRISTSIYGFCCPSDAYSLLKHKVTYLTNI